MLRDYQESIVGEVFDAWNSGDKSVLIVMATGLGKTITFWEITRQLLQKNRGKRVMIVAHRDELIQQAADKGKTFFNIDSDIEKAERRASRILTRTHGGLYSGEVVVASVQTLNSGPECPFCKERADLDYSQWKRANPTLEDEFWVGPEMGCENCIKGRMRRLQDFNPDDFCAVIFDEAHRSTADSYRNVVNHFGNSLVLGVTATPDRSDEEALGQVYDSVTTPYEILEGIKDGWLVPVQNVTINISGLDLTDVRTTAGELNKDDLRKAIKQVKEEGLHQFIEPTLDQVREVDGKALQFWESVESSTQACDLFNRWVEGVAAHVDGKTCKKTDRPQAIEDFASGKVKVLNNVGVFTEGFDESTASICAIARFSKSRNVIAQMVGRITRPHHSIVNKLYKAKDADERKKIIAESVKPYAYVIDYLGNLGKHQLVTVLDVLQGSTRDEAVVKAKAKMRSRAEAGEDMTHDVLEELQAAEQELIREEEAEKKRVRQSQPIVGVKYTKKTVDPFQIFDIDPFTHRGWDRTKKPTAAQKRALVKFKVDKEVVDKMSLGEAKQALDRLVDRADKGLCSLKQAKVLKKFGFDPDSTFVEARKIIDRIARSGWTLRGEWTPDGENAGQER